MTSPASRFVLVGHPVGHSVSPAIHLAAYRALGMNHRYEAVDVPDEAALERIFAELRTGRLRGANVTVPWKRAALEKADRATAVAAEVGAANVLGAEDGVITADNTDVPALVEELEPARDLPGPALVIGSGGAALAAVVACREGGRTVRATSRRWRADAEPATWPRAEQLRRLGAEPVAWPDPGCGGLGGVAIIVQATTAGMVGADPGEDVSAVVDWASLAPDAFAYDLVYNPPLTPFVRSARSAGLRAESGLGMLVGQAARAVEIWLGERPSAEPLLRAARAALGLEEAR